jgi:hypothetical protein
LLTGVLDALDWPRRILRGALGSTYGAAAVPCFLTGLALAVLDRFTESPTRLDAGLALFAGFAGEPDYAAVRRFLAEADPGEFVELLPAIGEQGPAHAEAAPAAFALLADALVRAFASRVRGFRQASRPFLVARLLATPGRIRLGPTSLRVVLAPNALHPALHVSGIDVTVQTVRWLGGRHVEFELEGL